MNNRYIIVYDFETSGLDPKVCDPTQIAAMVLNPYTLEQVPGGEFHSFMCPDKLPPVDDSTVAWHAQVRSTTAEAILDTWKSAPPEKQVWSDFAEFTKRFQTSGGKKRTSTQPIRAGANIINYDNIIWQRLCEKHGFVSPSGDQNLAFKRDNLDIQPMLWYWLEAYEGSPDSLSMDKLREYFDMPKGMAHDAMSDVNDCVMILRSFMKLMRNTAAKLNFKGCFGKNAKIRKQEENNGGE